MTAGKLSLSLICGSFLYPLGGSFLPWLLCLGVLKTMQRIGELYPQCQGCDQWARDRAFQHQCAGQHSGLRNGWFDARQQIIHNSSFQRSLIQNHKSTHFSPAKEVSFNVLNIIKQLQLSHRYTDEYITPYLQRIRTFLRR